VRTELGKQEEMPDGTVLATPRRADTMMLWREIFDDQVYATAAGRLAAGDTVLDVGANVGLASLYFARRVPGVRVLAFEPAADVFACLSANLAEHVPDSLALRQALGDTAGPRELFYYPNAPSQSGFDADTSAAAELTRTYLRNEGLEPGEIDYLCRDLHTARTETVTVTTVSEVLRAHRLDRIDLLKIDVERAEWEVLAGVRSEDWARIRSVVVEVHDLGDRLARVLDLLSSAGLTVTAHQEPWLEGSELHTVTATR